jgi:hypothetical protein
VARLVLVTRAFTSSPVVARLAAEAPDGAEPVTGPSRHL